MKAETLYDLEQFQAAVTEERARLLARRRIACVIAWGLIAVASSIVGFLLRATLLTTSPWGFTLFLALLIAAEINFIRLGNALRDEFKWPRPRRRLI